MNEQILKDYYKENNDCLYLTNTEKWPWMFQDHLVLLNIIDKFEVKTVFEIGTWQGFTAGAMLKKGVKIKAIDIYKGMNITYEHGSHKQADKENYGKYAKDPNYELVFCDSMKYEPNEERFDMVFIDGNHDYEHVKNDTELARKFNPKVIVWHDFPNEEGVKKYIDEVKASGKTIGLFKNSLMVSEDCRK